MVETVVTNGLEARFRVRPSESFVVDVVLSLAPGSTVALLGPNGAGKSTVVTTLAGLLPIDEGRIMLGDTILDDPGLGIFVSPEERAVGVVFQDYLLFPHLSVIENVAFGLRGAGVKRETAIDRAGAWLEAMDLGFLARGRPDDLSGGQRQQVALARALAIEPDVLLLDEPLSALDVTTRVEIRRALSRHLRDFAGPRLLITHDPTEAFLLADNVYVIENGLITQTGTADDIRLRPRTPYAADLAGANLIAGEAAEGVVETDGHRIHIADHTISGPVLATIRPSAISVHLHEPEGSPRNTWRTSIGVIEPLGDRVRLTTMGPLPLTVEITEEARQALSLVEGSPVWLSIKATEIAVEPGL